MKVLCVYHVYVNDENNIILQIPSGGIFISPRGTGIRIHTNYMQCQYISHMRKYTSRGLNLKRRTHILLTLSFICILNVLLKLKMI